MKKNFLFSMFIVIYQFAAATNYYLSNGGSDSNSGTSSSQPWQTITQLNTTLLLPGDSIFFEAGSIFRGEIIITSGGNDVSTIYFGKYGVGNLPVISGAQAVSGWTNYLGNIYRAPLNKNATQLFANNELMTIARFPNSGYLFQEGAIGSNGFIDSSLNQPENYWKNATVRMRMNDRSWEINTLDSSNGSQIFLTSPFQNPILSGYGYYMDNLLALLDTTREWFYNTLDSEVFFYSPSGSDPTGTSVEASVYNYGILIQNGSSYITIENIQFEKQAKDGIRVEGIANQLNIQESNFYNEGERGIIVVNGVHNSSIANCNFSRIAGQAINGYQMQSVTISRNAITSIGTIAGYGITLDYEGQAIHLEFSDSVSVLMNTIDSTGNAAIFAIGAQIFIENNTINHPLLHLNNTGGMFFFGSDCDSIFIVGNILHNILGSSEATPLNPIRTAGIYLDEGTRNFQVIGNTIYDASNSGIILNYNSQNHLISGNTIYNSASNQMLIEEGNSIAPSNGHIIHSNIFYSLSENQDIINLVSSEQDFIPALFDSNYYFNPYNFFAFHHLVLLPGLPLPDFYFSLEHWQEVTDEDSSSKETFFFRNRYTPTIQYGSNLISNGEFSNNTDGWENLTPIYSEIFLDNSTPLDFGCLKIAMTKFTDSAYADVLSNSFSTTSGKFYQLKFSSYSTHDGTVIFKQKEKSAPFTVGNLSRAFPFKNRSDYNITFEDTGGITAPYVLHINLQNGDSVVWLDNISIYETEVSYLNPETLSRLFVNSTSQAVSYDLGDTLFFDLDHNIITTEILLAPYTSMILIYDSALILGQNNPPIGLTLKNPILFPTLTSPGAIIHIESIDEKESQLILQNIDGTILRKIHMPGNSQEIQFRLDENLPSGIYLVTLISSKQMCTWKIAVN